MQGSYRRKLSFLFSQRVKSTVCATVVVISPADGLQQCTIITLDTLMETKDIIPWKERDIQWRMAIIIRIAFLCLTGQII